MLVLLSSNARRRYRDDIVRALAYPEGAEFRFRYAGKYIEPNIIARHDRICALNIPGIVCHLSDKAGASLAFRRSAPLSFSPCG